MVRSESLSTALNAETGETQPATELRICPTLEAPKARAAALVDSRLTLAFDGQRIG